MPLSSPEVAVFHDLEQGLDYSKTNKLESVVLVATIGCSDCSVRDWVYKQANRKSKKDYNWIISYIDIGDEKALLNKLKLDANFQPALYLLTSSGVVLKGPRGFDNDSGLHAFVFDE